jgi:hypothetical protein
MNPLHPLLNRRRFLSDAGTGLGAIALTAMLGRQGLLGSNVSGKEALRPEIDPGRPYAPRKPHFAPKAKNVLVIFCSGACSQLDTFDYKPELIRRHGQPMPGVDKLITFQGEQGALTKSPWEFRPRGQSGKMISDLVPHLGALADDLCFIHSMQGKTNTHGPGENFMSTGNTLDGFPCLGAWLTYALGSEDQSLPAYVAIPDPRGKPQNSVNNWAPGFLPAAFQGTDFNATKPIRNLARPGGLGSDSDAATRGFLQRLNAHHAERFPGDTALAARIASYELAARMQLTVPEIADLSSEPEHILKLYGADESGTPPTRGTASWRVALSNGGCASSSSSTGPIRPEAKASATGTVTRISSTSTASTVRCSTSPPPVCSSISSNVGCSTKPWSCGARNSVGCRRSRRVPKGAITTLLDSPAGWRARA